MPFSAEGTTQNRMNAEHAILEPTAAGKLNNVRARGGRAAAVRTTAPHILESAASEDGLLRFFDGDTDIFITPDYHICVADVLLTSFHLPRSTLFMLVSAFMGLQTMQVAYAEAICITR